MTPYMRKARKLAAYLMLASLASVVMLCLMASGARAADTCTRYANTIGREAQAVYGPDAPVPLFLAQARQESSCRDSVTAWDNGRGLYQFMDGTSAQAARLFPELGPANPYDATWSIRAAVRFDGWLRLRVKGKDECNRWGATLKAYNAGLGYVQQAQAKSPDPARWFGITEYVPTRQSPANFEASRLYPRWILLRHQPLFAHFGPLTCPGLAP